MLMSLTRIGRLGAAALGLALLPATSAMAGEGRAHEWQMGFQRAATEIAQQMQDFHTLLLVIISFVLLAHFSGAPPDSTYIPAHIENGRLVPGVEK